LSKREAAARTQTPTTTLVKTIVEALQELKGVDITVLDLRKIPEASADFFIVCNGTSTTHIGGLSDRVEKNTWEQLGEKPYHIEGRQGRLWLLLDYFSVVVHIFDREKRQFYDVEHLWSDAKVQKY
jgi:ribosome-associated protein